MSHERIDARSLAMHRAIAKHVAGREKDIEFTEALARHDMVRRDVLEERLAATKVADRIRAIIARRIEAQFTSGTAPRSPA